jgi:hypothetical protein
MTVHYGEGNFLNAIENPIIQQGGPVALTLLPVASEMQ